MAGPSLGRCIDAQVVDISGSGIRVQTRVPVPCGVAVKIHDRTLVLAGEICRCVPDQEVYMVGIRVFETLIADDTEPVSSLARP